MTMRGNTDMASGIIFKAMSGFYYVESAEGTVECRARGRFRLEKTVPLVGDNVEYTLLAPGKGVLDAILPRKNAFIRPPIANIEKMVILASGAIPITDPYLIDRMTAIAEKNGCEAVICINKYDLNPADELYDIYTQSGFTTIRTSAETGQGMDDLLRAISGSLCAFTGNSGVGKSSVLNMMNPDFDISVGDVSKKLGRGRHTTRHVELYTLPGGTIIADTPGFSAFDTQELNSKRDLQFMFPDFVPYIGSCRFLDCAHIKEPGCAVLQAVGEGKIQKSRHRSYVRLYEDAAKFKEWEIKGDI